MVTKSTWSSRTADHHCHPQDLDQFGETIRLASLVHPNPHSQALFQTTHHALSNDAMAEWSSLETSLQDLHIVLNRQMVPKEWKLDGTTWPSGEATSYVKATYMWVKEHFDGRLPLHQTAMMVAIFFSKVLPKVFHHCKATDDLKHANTTQVVRDAPWVVTSSTNRKGTTSPVPFIVMMSTFIISIQYMTPSHPLGHTWTPIQTILVSHGPRSTVCLSIFLFCHTDCTSGVKGIVPFNLVCLGLACAQGNGIFKAAKFNVSWSLLKDKDLKAFHSDMIHNLKDLPYEPFIQLTNMFSVWMAQEIARKGEAIECPLTKRVADELCESGPSKYSCF